MGDFQRVMMFLDENCHTFAYIGHVIYRYPAYTERLGSFLVGRFKDCQPSLWIIGKTSFQSKNSQTPSTSVNHVYPGTLRVGVFGAFIAVLHLHEMEGQHLCTDPRQPHGPNVLGSWSLCSSDKSITQVSCFLEGFCNQNHPGFFCPDPCQVWPCFQAKPKQLILEEPERVQSAPTAWCLLHGSSRFTSLQWPTAGTWSPSCGNLNP